ncbi:src-like-adapter 2 [Bombina bombina]|uniref:src-like-adapter 2 n=1 Tax=Bombina bombina TaxID=8345 RepID=UPI00235A504A|nr:src-like-adapter 2 [Bombina bombina]
MDKCIFVALYNFPLGGQAAITIQVGEQLNILSEDGDWYKVSSLSTGKECYMPKSNVTKVFNRWLYKGITREKAEELLLMSCNHNGSFLIRESVSRKECFTLSVKQTNRGSQDTIKHYLINRLENGWLYISPRLTFPTLKEMVDYYTETADGICCILKEPCITQGATNTLGRNSSGPVMIRKKTLNWNELDSSALFSKDGNFSDDCPVSVGLREAVSSYMLMTEDINSDSPSEKDFLWKT